MQNEYPQSNSPTRRWLWQFGLGIGATLLVVSFATSQVPENSAQNRLEVTMPPLEGVVAGTAFPGAGKSGPVIQTAVSNEMIGFSHMDSSGTQIITLVHTGKSWMTVYHIHSGVIRLVSSRPIDADFSLQLNATAPLPEDIRMLGSQGK
jgi:hypothetical protein